MMVTINYRYGKSKECAHGAYYTHEHAYHTFIITVFVFIWYS